MKEKFILNAHIYNGILAGAENIAIHCENLNAANGFPVPDRDTGNNLTFLMQHITRHMKHAPNIREMMNDVSDAAIVGARGNSGAIFSQFFHGFQKGCPDETKMTLDHLVVCFEKGYDFAYGAIQNPVEGTIVTAIRSFSQGLRQALHRGDNLKKVYEEAYQELKDTVSETKYTLAEQAALQAEDAGAKAFLYFVEGFMKMIVEGVSSYVSHIFDPASEAHPMEIEMAHPFTGPITYAYCTEVLLRKKSKIGKDQIESMLSSLGDSVVISENDHFMRVHIHTNEPWQVVETLHTIGPILETKADDMKMQERLSKAHLGEVALVVDSIADFPTADLPDFVYQMPLYLMVDGVSYQDKRTVFPALLKSGKAGSSQPNLKQVEGFLAPIVKAYDHVFILSVSAKMSGLYDRYAQAEQKFKEKITLIDTKLNSVAEGLVARRAVQLIQEQRAPSFIQASLQNLIDRTKIYVSLKHLKAMVDSGRLNEKVGWILQKIGFLPLITINKKGEGAIQGVAFSRAQNEKLLYQTAGKVRDDIEDYALVYAESKERVDEIAEKMTQIIGKPPVYIEEISSIVQIFSGPGSVAIGYVLKEGKQ